MHTDPHGWFLTSQALDQKDTTGALTVAMVNADSGEGLGPFMIDQLSSDMAIELARAGYALVRLTPVHPGSTDLTSFLARKQD